MPKRKGQKYVPVPKRDYDVKKTGDMVRNPKKEQYDMPVIKKWGKSKKSFTI